MKYSAISLLLLWIALPCRGQDDPNHLVDTPVLNVVLAEPPVIPDSIEVPDVPLPSATQTEKIIDTGMHKEKCGCDTCARHRRGRSGWNLYGKLKTWWDTEAEPYMIDTHWGHEAYFHERPFGSYVDAAVESQVANGMRDRLVLYQYDFEENSPRLRPRGYRQLQEIWAKAQCLGQPLVIEASQNPERPGLDESRRALVMGELGLDPNNEAAWNLVIVCKPAAFGLARGSVLRMRSEPEIIWYNQLRNTDQQGQARISNGSTSR